MNKNDNDQSHDMSVAVVPINRERAAKAAEKANAAYGQWMPERWLHLFINAYEGKSL